MAVSPADFIEVLDRLQTRLSRGTQSAKCGPAERRIIHSVVGTWYSQYRSTFDQILGEENLIATMDGRMDRVLNSASNDSLRSTILKSVKSAKGYFTDALLVPLSRAYWSRVPQTTPAGRDDLVVLRLRKLDPNLADSYDQAVIDLEDSKRLSYRGPAAELREVLSTVLHKLAPNNDVEATDWYKESKRSGTRKEPTPTRAERTKYILRNRLKGSAVTDSAESYVSMVEDRLEGVVNATYRRGSAATHAGAERNEVGILLPYLNALLRELLPP
jgi:hypothetical protein